jgi:hypothetical protein
MGKRKRGERADYGLTTASDKISHVEKERPRLAESKRNHFSGTGISGGAYFARFHTASVDTPELVAGLVYFSSFATKKLSYKLPGLHDSREPRIERL